MMDNFSIESIQLRSQSDPVFASFLKYVNCNSYDDFLSMLYEELDNAIHQLEINPKFNTKLSEDDLTDKIITYLKATKLFKYVGHDDHQGGGHCDISVTFQKYTWLCEAKIWNGPQWALDGFNQLTTRYVVGNRKGQECGLLLYIKIPNAKKCMSDWKQKLETLSLQNFVVTPSQEREDFCFFTSHDHSSSGIPIKVKHLGVILYYNPLK